MGKRLLKVSDIMHSGSAIPLSSGNELMSEVIPEMTAKSFGVRSVTDQEPVTDDTLFCIGSCSKMISAAMWFDMTMIA